MDIFGKREANEERSNFMIYHACIHPHGKYSIKFWDVMPVNQVLLYLVDAVIISGEKWEYYFMVNQIIQINHGKCISHSLFLTLYSGNWYLYKFMKTISENKKKIFGKVDTKKERRMNLIPARIGIYSIIIFVFCAILQFFVHLVPFFDNESKALTLAMINDVFYCFVAPTLILYGMPGVWRHLNSVNPFGSL